MRCEAVMVLARCTIGTDLDGSATQFRRAAQIAAEHGLTPWRAEALFGLGSVQLTAGEPTAPALTQARELAEQCGMLAQALQADILRADAALLLTGPRAALDLARTAAERAGRMRLTSMQGMAELVAASAAALSDDRATMTALIDAAGSRADVTAEVQTLAPVVQALSYVIKHDLARAAVLVDEGIAAILTHGSAAPTPYYGLWALLQTAIGDRGDESRSRLREHLTIVLEAAVADGWGDPVSVLRADLAMHEAVGDLALARTWSPTQRSPPGCSCQRARSRPM